MDFQNFFFPGLVLHVFSGFGMIIDVPIRKGTNTLPGTCDFFKVFITPFYHSILVFAYERIYLLCFVIKTELKSTAG